MSVKIEAYEYDGKLFRHEEDVLDYQAQELLEAEYMNNFGGNVSKMMKNPKRIYNILKGVYGDR
jgi:hypothetical protein